MDIPGKSVSGAPGTQSRTSGPTADRAIRTGKTALTQPLPYARSERPGSQMARPDRESQVRTRLPAGGRWIRTLRLTQKAEHSYCFFKYQPFIGLTRG